MAKFKKFESMAAVADYRNKKIREASSEMFNFYTNIVRKQVQTLRFEDIKDDEEFFFPAAYIAARFPDRDQVWGTVRPSLIIVYGLYLKQRGNAPSAMETVFWHSRGKPEFEYIETEQWEGADSVEFQHSMLSCTESFTKPPLNPTMNLICVNKQHGEDLLTLCFPGGPKSATLFRLVDPLDWVNPLDEMESMFSFCFSMNAPDLQATYSDMGLSSQEAYEWQQTDEFLKISQQILKAPLMKALRLDMRDVNNGEKAARARMLKMFSEKGAFVNLFANLALPIVQQRDMPAQSELNTVYTDVLMAPDPTDNGEQTDLVHKPG